MSQPIPSSSQPPIHFGNFSFKTIGKPPGLLQRISSSTGDFQYSLPEQQSPSPITTTQQYGQPDHTHPSPTAGLRQLQFMADPQPATNTTPIAQVARVHGLPPKPASLVAMKERPPSTPARKPSQEVSVPRTNPYPPHADNAPQFTTPITSKTLMPAIAPVASTPMKAFMQDLNTRLDGIILPSTSSSVQRTDDGESRPAPQSGLELLAHISSTNATLSSTKAQTVQAFIQRAMTATQAALNAASQLTAASQEVQRTSGDLTTLIKDEQLAEKIRSVEVRQCVEDLRAWAEAEIGRVEVESESVLRENIRLSKENEVLTNAKDEVERKLRVEQERRMTELSKRATEMETVRQKEEDMSRRLQEAEELLTQFRMKEQERKRAQILEARNAAQAEEAARIQTQRQDLLSRISDPVPPRASLALQEQSLPTATPDCSSIRPDSPAVAPTPSEPLPSSSLASEFRPIAVLPAEQSLSVVKVEPKEERLTPLISHPSSVPKTPSHQNGKTSLPLGFQDRDRGNIDAHMNDPNKCISPKAVALNVRHLKKARDMENSSLGSKNANDQLPTPPVTGSGDSGAFMVGVVPSIPAGIQPLHESNHVSLPPIATTVEGHPTERSLHPLNHDATRHSIPHTPLVQLANEGDRDVPFSQQQYAVRRINRHIANRVPSMSSMSNSQRNDPAPSQTAYSDAQVFSMPSNIAENPPSSSLLHEKNRISKADTVIQGRTIDGDRLHGTFTEQEPQYSNRRNPAPDRHTSANPYPTANNPVPPTNDSHPSFQPIAASKSVYSDEPAHRPNRKPFLSNEQPRRPSYARKSDHWSPPSPPSRSRRDFRSPERSPASPTWNRHSPEPPRHHWRPPSPPPRYGGSSYRPFDEYRGSQRRLTPSPPPEHNGNCKKRLRSPEPPSPRQQQRRVSNDNRGSRDYYPTYHNDERSYNPAVLGLNDRQDLQRQIHSQSPDDRSRSGGGGVSPPPARGPYNSHFSPYNDQQRSRSRTPDGHGRHSDSSEGPPQFLQRLGDAPHRQVSNHRGRGRGGRALADRLGNPSLRERLS